MRRIPRRELLSLLLATTAGCSLPGGADDGERSTTGLPPTGTGTMTGTDPAPTGEPTDSATPGDPQAGATSLVDELTGGSVVAVARDLDATVVDPATTDRPVQTALDRVGPRGGGRVFLPPTEVREAGPVRPYTNTGIYGVGMNVSVLTITRPGVDGIRFDREPGIHRVQLDGFELRGPGLDVQSGPAVHFVDPGPTADAADVSVGRLYCQFWTDAVVRVDEGTGPYQCRFDFLRVDTCDAGDASGLVEWNSSYGPANRFGTLVAYPEADFSGRNTTVLHQRGGELAVDDVSVGGAAGTVVDQRNGQLTVDRVHYEPTDQRAVPPAIVRLAGDGAAVVGDVVHDSGTVDHVYELADDPANKRFGFGRRSRGTVRRAVVGVSGVPDPDRPSWYFGRVEDVAVRHGGPRRGGLRVLGTAGTGVA